LTRPLKRGERKIRQLISFCVFGNIQPTYGLFFGIIQALVIGERLTKSDASDISREVEFAVVVVEKADEQIAWGNKGWLRSSLTIKVKFKPLVSPKLDEFSLL
jgi:hypothetical protein